MFKNYLVVAWRNITRNRFYSLINIIGLSAGIGFTMLIGAYVWSELQVNGQLKDLGHQYIIQSKWKDPNQGFELTTVGPLAKQLRESYPGLVANYYRWDGVTSVVSRGNKSFREGLQICDSTMFSMYGFRLLQGNPATAFREPFSVVLTPGKAIKYFGKVDVLGQTITIENFSGARQDFTITGVLAPPGKNSVTHITDDNDNQLYVPLHNIGFFGRTMDWSDAYRVGYVELQPGARPEEVEKRMRTLLRQNAPAQIADNLQPYLVPLKSYYLTANNGLVKKMLYALSAIAAFILLMAVVNFINMSVGRSATRMRETGMRRVMGGLRKQIIVQFLVESAVIGCLATLAGLGAYTLVKGIFGRILGETMPGLAAFPVYFILAPVLLALGVGLLAGIYPALILSSVKPADSVKGKLTGIRDRVLLRKSLVAFQFAISTIAFAAAIIISRQVQLFFSREIGFNKDYLVSVAVPRNWSAEGVRKMEYIRQQLAEQPSVAAASLTYTIPDGGSVGSIGLYTSRADSSAAPAFQGVVADEHYAATYHIPMLAGNFFCPSGSALTDSSAIVLNETGARALGWKNPQDAIGRRVMAADGSGSQYTIAGVTKDFHFTSMMATIPPLVFLHVGRQPVYRFFAIRFKPGDVAVSLASIEKQWKVWLPGEPFEYVFMDESLRRLYKTELQLKQAAYVATVLSFTIVLLGICGLVSISVQKRTREIGIRKVLGSSTADIVAIFLKEISMVMGTAVLVACPAGYLIMNRWIQDYAYRTDITAAPFILSVLVLGLASGVTIIAFTVKTALAKPAQTLRAE